MILAIKYVFGEDGQVKLSKARLPSPLIVLTCPRLMPLDIANQSAHKIAYQKWLSESLDECVEKGYFAVVHIPVQYLGLRYFNDSVVQNFLNCQSIVKRSHVMAVHLSRGTLSKWDYHLRLYSVLRKGLSFSLIIDPGNVITDAYRVHAVRAAQGVWSESYKEVKNIRQAFWEIIKELFRTKVFCLVVRNQTYENGELWKRLNKWISSKRMWLRLSKGYTTTSNPGTRTS